jgi:hypothetical protein
MKNGPSLGGGPEAKLNLQNSAGNSALPTKGTVSSHSFRSTSSGNSDSALERLAERANALAAGVMAGHLAFIDLFAGTRDYGAALGLTDDVVQEVLFAAFKGIGGGDE